MAVQGLERFIKPGLTENEIKELLSLGAESIAWVLMELSARMKIELDFYDDKLPGALESTHLNFNWIFLANALVPLLGENNERKEQFEHTFQQIFGTLTSPTILLTVVEGGTINTLPREFISDLRNINFAGYSIEEKAIIEIGPDHPVEAYWILDCKKYGIYRTRLNLYIPEINSCTLLLRRN